MWAYSRQGRGDGAEQARPTGRGYARRPQVQERLTQQIADALVEYAGARGVIVVTECEHLCMSMRGIKKSSARTVTSAVRGMLRNPATRAEAMSLILDK